MMKKNVLISACLLGLDCKYNGENNLAQKITDLINGNQNVCFIPVCPEQMGGLCTPREPCEIIQDRQSVESEQGNDFSKQFAKGAKETLKLARLFDCKMALLKENSPSCGSHTIYDGTFSHRKIEGMGYTASLLQLNGIEVFSENEIEMFCTKCNDKL